MNNLIQNEILKFIEQYNLSDKTTPYIVAFSGGYDSMCLLHALSQTVKNPLIAVHLNHNWRGAESDLEEKKCAEFCKQYNIKFYSEKLGNDVQKTETKAREARYNFFTRCAKKFKTNVVFTAHNADDNAETLLYRIIKGTAVDGLCGILPKRDIYYRPLLKIKRIEIEKYCTENSLTPNKDSSNENTKYSRNYIRHKILPLAKRVNPDAVDAINSLSETATRDTEYFYNEVRVVGNDTTKFITSHPAIQNRIIKQILCENNIDYDREHIEYLSDFIIFNANSKSGKTCSLSLNKNLYVNNSYFKVIETSENINSEEVCINKEGTYKFMNGEFTIKKCIDIPSKFPTDNEYCAYINIDEINFTLRTRRNGDIIYPLGANGKQKLKKYLNEKKIPQHEKDRLIMLAQKDEILWIAGVGMSDKIKVNEKATHIIKFKKES